MVREIVRFLRGGKVKDIYEIEDDPDHLLFEFSDRVSAYDVKFPQPIPRKGEVLCRSAEFWFGTLAGVPHHFVRRESDTAIVVRRMQMLPIECVVRGHLYGSLYDRYASGGIVLPDGVVGDDDRMASRLLRPLFDPTTKSDQHDVPISRDEATSAGLLSDAQYDWLESASVSIYERMYGIADSAGFILADLKLEFGVLDGEITLGDSIGPDEYRMWPKDGFEPGRVQDSYDKQVLRDWLSANGYKKAFDDARAAGRDPVAPTIPADIISDMSRRYVDSFERISGTRL